MFQRSLIKKVAKLEMVPASFLEKQLRRKRAIIPLNQKRELKRPVAIGEGLKIKINTNIGTSTSRTDIDDEMRKLKIAVKYQTDTIMDLSVGGNLRRVRQKITRNCPVAVGTVPIYQIAYEAERKKGNFEKFNFADIWDVLKEQAQDGIDFFTIHAGILKNFLKIIKKKKRVGGIVSRGGAILARWMYVIDRQNPFYENFDHILDLAKKYNITLSLGDALRPGAIADSTDKLQVKELHVLAELVKRCRRKDVQVMVEGPGHIRLDEIAFNVRLQKKLCDYAPLYVLGPLPTDIAAGYDHITSAIGGALSGLAGADFLCVVTPAEHLRHPSVNDVKEGVIASRIAAHCVDVLRFKDEWKKDSLLSLYRSQRKWKKMFTFALDEDKAKKYRGKKHLNDGICTMCGKFCSLKINEECGLLK